MPLRSVKVEAIRQRRAFHVRLAGTRCKFVRWRRRPRRRAGFGSARRDLVPRV